MSKNNKKDEKNKPKGKGGRPGKPIKIDTDFDTAIDNLIKHPPKKEK